MKTETELKIRIGIDENTDLNNLKPTDKLTINISHENCGNEKLDKFADDVGQIVGFVFQQYNAILAEKNNMPINKDINIE